MGYRKGSGGGESSSGGTNLTTIIMGAITIVLALIGLGIAMDTIAPYLTGGASALNWTRYPGGEPMLKLFPLIMLVGLVIFGGVMVWLGTGADRSPSRTRFSWSSPSSSRSSCCP